ncbi:MAG: hypothetical protein GKR92_09095 [Gammaproteobacteria bacterium]|nr:MAG: hypothetical protein GKR92_09095 [Gammaproteobacteria bacterium]
MTAQATIEIQNPLSLQQFIKLLQKLPPGRIADLPIEKLPNNIPADISEKIPMASRSAVDDLIMTANSFHLKRRMRDQESYGTHVVTALDKAKGASGSANLRVFKNKILLLVEMLQSTQRGTKKIGNDTFVKHITSINNLLIDVRSETISLHENIVVLQKSKPINDADKKRFSSSLYSLKKETTSVGKILSEYYILRLKVLARAIHQKRKLIEIREETTQIKQQELDDLQTDLKEAQTLWNRTMKRKKTIDDTKDTQQRIYDLVNEIKASEVVIAESDLILWLDAIVEASLNEGSKQRVLKSLRQARISLFYLLNKFCASQEASAIQIAKNPFIQVDPEKAIKFVLMSETFILNYFTKKKNTATAWLSGAAENKMVELDQLQKDILTELRRASKSMFKL